jgi:hypothetical protein
MKTSFFTAFLTLAVVTPVLRGQISIVSAGASGAYQVNRSGHYSQDFSALVNTGNGSQWDSNVTIPGWYADRRAGVAVTLKGFDGITLINYGETASSDRALGMIGASYFGLRFANATDITITGLDVTFDGEQWERSPNNPQRPDTLYFEYQIFNANAGQLFGTGWTGVEALNFTSVSFVDPTYAFLDGNAEANRIADIEHFISGLSLAPGQEIWLRWRGFNNPGYNHGLAIDNLRVSFASIPEPSAVAALMGTAALIFTAGRRRRR